MARTHLSKQTARAIVRYGPSVNRLARQRYHVSGQSLLARLVAGESGDNPNAVSYAGARGRTQFMPATRQAVLRLTHGRVDPWRSADEAVHAAVLHLTGRLGNAKGLEGYNPGSSSYPSYILSRRTDLGRVKRQLGLGGGGGRARVAAPGGGGQVQLGSLADELGPLARMDLSSLLPQRQAPPASGPAEPAFSARARLPMPNGAQLVPEASGPPAPKLDLSRLLNVALAGGGAQGLTRLTGPQGAAGGQGGGGAAGGGGGRLGKVTVAAGANRAGAPLHGDVIRFTRRVAGLVGHPLTIGTGTNHSRLTINGTESDHWRGEGADVPLTGRQLVRAGQAALIAAGMSAKRARKIHGGGFNVGGWQIIFNTDAPGWGNHLTHLHIGRRRA